MTRNTAQYWVKEAREANRWAITCPSDSPFGAKYRARRNRCMMYARMAAGKPSSRYFVVGATVYDR